METKPKQQHPHESAYCGLAAIAIAVVFLLMAIPALQLAFFLYASGYRGWPESDRRLAYYAGYFAMGAIELISWAGVFIAGRGIAAGGRTGEPRVLSVVGLILCVLSALIWIGGWTAWYSQSGIILRNWN